MNIVYIGEYLCQLAINDNGAEEHKSVVDFRNEP